MALNRKPRRPITDADRSFAGRDSLVCLRQVRGQDSVDPLRPLAKRIVGGEEYSGRLPGCPGRSLARRASTFHPLVFELPLTQAACEVIGSSAAHFTRDMEPSDLGAA